MEFYPANGAYQNVGINGFRTFIKEMNQEDETSPDSIYEPFSNTKESSTKMVIRKDSFSIEEVNKVIGLKVNVQYSTLSNVPIGGLSEV